MRVETIMGITAVQQNSYDMSTWEVSSSFNGSAKDVATANTFDSDLGLAYGCYFNEDGATFSFCSVNVGYFNATPISPLSKAWGACGFNKDGVLYAIDIDGVLMTVDIDNGNTTVVGDTQLKNENITGGMVDKESNTMIYAIKTDAEAALYSIDLATAKATKLYDLANEEQLGGFFAPAKEYPSDAPGKSTSSASISLNSSDPSKATFSFYSPRYTVGGALGSGNITYHVYCNGKEIASGETTYNKGRQTVPVEIEKSGYYCYAVSFSNEAGEGPRSRADAKYMGWDTPRTPASFTLSSYADGKVSMRWGSVSSGKHSGTIDRSNLTYRVTRYPDGVVVSPADLKTVSMTDEIGTPEVRTKYWYTVEAVTGDLKSDAGKSAEFALGPIVPPYSTSFESTADFFEYTTLNPAADTKEWKISASDKCISVSTSSKPADNWLVLPVLNLKGGESYEFEIEARSYGSNYTEEFEVFAGKEATVEAMTLPVIEKTTVKGSTYVAFKGTVAADADGKYYIGIHATTPTNGGYLYINSISIGKGVSDKAPAAVTALEVIPDATGAHSATVKFTTPTVTLGNEALAEITRIELLRDGEVVKTLTSGIAVGEEVSMVDDADPAAGKHVYSVICYNAFGAGTEVSAEAFIGFGAPVNPSDIVMTEPSNGHVKATWAPVTVDVDGRRLSAADVKYNVYKYLAGDLYPVAENVSETTIEYDAFDGFEAFDGQRFVQTIIEAVTEGGVSKKVPSEQVAIGNPYVAPWSESFANCKVSSIFATKKVKGDDAWSMVPSDDFGTTPADGDGGMMLLEAYGRGACSLITGKIDLGDVVSPAFVFQVYNYMSSNPNENVIEVEVYYDGEYVKLYSATVKELGNEPKWCTVTVPLDEYAGQVIQLRITAYNNTFAITHIDDLKVTSAAPYNLAVASVDAPLSVDPNADFTISADIENIGTEAANIYKVRLVRDDEEIDIQSGKAIESGQKVTVKFTDNLSIMEVGDHNYAVEIVYGLDMYEGDNVKEFVIVARSNNLPVVSDLDAKISGASVDLTWSAPKNLTVPTASTESFDAPSLSWATEVPGWTFLDKDGGTMGGIGNKQLPVSGRQSFFVFDNTLPVLQNGNIAAFNAHSGNQYLCSMYSKIGSNFIPSDDWAISPELTGEPQTISLWATSFPSDPGEPQYLETFQILYSTTGTEVEDFTLISEFTNIPAQWRQYSAYLPEGAKYFAIRCVSYDQYMLFVDDVTFIAKNGATKVLEVNGYNVYRDGKRLNSEPIVTAAYTDSEVDAKSVYTYAVTAVYADGESMKSNEAVVDMSVGGVDGTFSSGVNIATGAGCVVVTGAEGEIVEVFAADGKSVAAVDGESQTTITLAPGFYIVKAGETVAKVAVK